MIGDAVNFTMEDIKNLRGKTGAGIMDCKEALAAANGNIDQAIVHLRKKGLAGIVDRGDKTAKEGIVAHYIHAGGKIGVLVEINSETDFVAKNAEFQEFAHDIAIQIAASNPQFISRDKVPDEFINRELGIITASIQGKPPDIVEKITKGKLDKVFREVCLMEQSWVKNPDMSITDLLGDVAAKIGEKIVIKRFVRFAIGE